MEMEKTDEQYWCIQHMNRLTLLEQSVNDENRYLNRDFQKMQIRLACW